MEIMGSTEEIWSDLHMNSIPLDVFHINGLKGYSTSFVCGSEEEVLS